MQRDFHRQLLGRQTSLLESIVLMDELDGENRGWRVKRHGFLDARSVSDGGCKGKDDLRSIGTAAYGFGDDSKREIPW